MEAQKERSKGIQRVLVKGTNWVGDTIISFPAVSALRHHFPKARFSVLTRSVIFPRSFSSALMVFLGGVPQRVGYTGEGRGVLLTERVACTDELLGRHRMYYYLHLIEALGRCPSPPLPTLSLNGKLEGWADGFLARNDLRREVLIGLNPGATYGEAKCWPPDRFAALGRRLIKDHGASILIFGSSRPQEKVLNASIAGGIGEGCLNLSGETSLLQLAALLRRCRLLITNDTGTMHVAAAVGTKVAAIFGPTDPRTTSPLGEGHVVIHREIACSPCLKRVCPTDHRCMELVSVTDVLEAVQEGL
jgi:heptosyltransferase-2